MSLYWLFVVGNFSDALAGFLVLSMFVLFCSLLVYGVTNEAYPTDEQIKFKNTQKKWSYRLLIATLIAGFIKPLFPSQDQVMMIAAGNLISSAEGSEKLPDNVMGALNAFLEKYQEK